jgi:hypothetical protein
MRGRVAVLFLLLLVSSLPSAAQCNWTPHLSTQFRFPAYDADVRNEFVWIATGYGVRILEEATLRIADDLALPGNTRVLETAPNGVAYVGSGSRLYVVQRTGPTLTSLRFVDAGATIHDILAVGSYLFVATSKGLLHYDAIDPVTPVRTAATLFTTSEEVTSLAVANNKLYAADGDNTLDVFSVSVPSFPQRTGELATLSRATAVHTALDGTIYVSDAFGQNTDVFVDTTRIARLPVGSNAFAPSPGGVQFLSGPDRTLRAVDFSTTTVVKELFEHQLAPSGGTENVIRDIARSGNRVYVSAADIGLAVFDVSGLAAPFPLAAYRIAPMNSTVIDGERAWFADGSGTISEERVIPGGIGLITEREWQGGTRVHDVSGSALLTSNGSTTTLWSLTPSTPTVTATTTYAGNVRAAAIQDDRVVALLDDGSVWSGATPARADLPPIGFMARSGSALVFAELRNEGSTVLHYFTSLTTSPVKFTLAGVTTTLALDATRAAVFTFRGVEIIRLDGSGGFTIEGSDAFIPRQVAFSGEDILVLDTRHLHVYDRDGTLIREHFLPADAVALDARPSVASIATLEGTAVVSYRAAQQPAPLVTPASRFYTKAVAGTDRVYLFAADAIDVFSTSTSDTPRYVTSISAAGVLDIAATSDALFTVSAGGVVSAYSRQSGLLRQVTINEGPDAQPLGIDTAGNAVWVSLSTGCQTGGCQEKTVVLDPATLAVTASMTGSVKDVVTAGTRAYVLTSFPSEIRVLNIGDPLRPAPVATAAAPASATSLTAHSGRVLVIGDKLYEYTESTLAQRATHFDAITPDKAQQIRVDGSCLIITARGANPELYNAATLAPVGGAIEVPSAVRSMAQQQGRLILLTGHSLEVWRSGSAVDGGKRRAVN